MRWGLRHTTAAFALAALAALSCQGPPGSSTSAPDAEPAPPDASTTGDAIAAPDAPAPAFDAAPSDASALPNDGSMADAPIPDDATPDAPPPGPPGIHLVEVTAFVGPDLLGGRDDPNPWGLGSGAAVGDVDGDGDLDLFLARCDSTSPPGGPSVLLLNHGPAGGFVDFVEDPAMRSEHLGTCAHSAAFGDLDSDGDLDLFVIQNGGDRLFRNDGNAGFTDIALAAGVTGPPDDRNSSVYLVDLNHDGLLDILVLAHTAQSPPLPSPLLANQLYINRGDMRFESAGDKAGIEGNGVSQAAAIADLDGDGDLEIYVANDRYAINGNSGTSDLDPDQWLDPLFYDSRNLPAFTDRSAAYHTDGMRSSMGVAVHDLDGDGRDEIFVSDWGSNHLQVWDPSSGHYQEQASAWNLARTFTASNHYMVSWHAGFLDLDRDGREEFLLINGSVYNPVSCASWSQLDVYMERVPMLDSFVDITAQVGWPSLVECPPTMDTPISGRGAVLADLDGDGDDDLVVTPWLEKYRFYRNDTVTGGAHHLRLEPRGTVSAPTPYGAVLVVTRPDGVTVRRVLYAGGTQAQGQPVIEAGLAGYGTVLAATLHWPSGYVQRIDRRPDFALDSAWRLVEPAWLTLSARRVGPADPAPVLLYRPVDENGDFLGPVAAGRSVTVTRSDGFPVAVTDHGDGTYSALLPHRGVVRDVAIRVLDEGVALRPRLSIRYL